MVSPPRSSSSQTPRSTGRASREVSGGRQREVAWRLLFLVFGFQARRRLLRRREQSSYATSSVSIRSNKRNVVTRAWRRGCGGAVFRFERRQRVYSIFSARCSAPLVRNSSRSAARRVISCGPAGLHAAHDEVVHRGMQPVECVAKCGDFIHGWPFCISATRQVAKPNRYGVIVLGDGFSRPPIDRAGFYALCTSRRCRSTNPCRVPAFVPCWCSPSY